MSKSLVLVINPLCDEPGYQYDIYASEEDYENAESLDGGICTTSFANALKMAYSQILPKERAPKKPKEDFNDAQHPIRQKAIEIIEQTIEPLLPNNSLEGVPYYETEDRLVEQLRSLIQSRYE